MVCGFSLYFRSYVRWCDMSDNMLIPHRYAGIGRVRIHVVLPVCVVGSGRRTRCYIKMLGGRECSVKWKRAARASTVATTELAGEAFPRAFAITWRRKSIPHCRTGNPWSEGAMHNSWCKENPFSSGLGQTLAHSTKPLCRVVIPGFH